MTPPLRCQREEFSLPRDAHYLNCAYMGPLPRVAEEAGIAGLRRKRFPQAISTAEFFEPVEQLKADFARLIGASDASRVVTVPAVSYAASTAARNTPAGPGSNIVLLHQQFPGNVYSWRRRLQESGGELRVVLPPPGAARGEGWTDRILNAIDSGTRAVAMGTVHWTDGTRFDLEAIRARTLEVGAALILDGTQSVGAAPINVDSLKPDALLVAGYKWLLGPYSLSLAYFGERYLDGVPLEETWIARRGSRNFAGLVEYQEEYEPGAARFEVGQRSNFALVPALAASIRLIRRWDPERTSAYCAALTEEWIPKLRELGVQIERRAWRSPHLFGCRLPASVSAQAVGSAMDARRVGVSMRGQSVRVSPYVYNARSDMEAFADGMEAAIRAGAD